MATPARLLDRLPPALVRTLKPRPAERFLGPAPLGFGIDGLDAVLPEGGLLRGAVIELALSEGAPGTTLALSLCRTLQREASRQGRELPWCAFVDPGGTLHAPGVVEAGVRLDHVLVVRPPLEALERTACRLAHSIAFELVLVDMVGVPGGSLRVPLRAWPRTARKLAMEVEGTNRTVILLTSAGAARPLPLPVAQRLEVTRPALDRLVVR